jgi:hypothetical protein
MVDFGVMTGLGPGFPRGRRANCLWSVPEGDAVANTGNSVDRSLEIFIDELIADEELRQFFFKSPLNTLRHAREWGVPLSDSEIGSLLASGSYVWDRVADALSSQLLEAA